ncbi:MAG: fructose-bisphosphate aldolase [Deltaproteobacteria bacterium]|nr:fructose-bisphosphate aldolase [Deltaproteobacteria bacterium]
MTGIGKKIRMERIFDRISKKTIIVPMIHDVGDGQVAGTVDMSEAVDKVARSGANAVVIQKDEVSAGHRGRGKDVGLIVHMSSSIKFSDNYNDNVIVCPVKEAVSLGADAVSIHVHFEKGKEKKVLDEFAAIVDQSNEYGMPLLGMVYPRGSKVEKGKEYDAEYVRNCVRLADELGVDIVNVNYTGSQETFQHVVAACKIPVVVADGPKMGSEKEILEMVEGAMMAGAAGFSIGPNIFQRDDLTAVIGKMSKIVHKDAHMEDFYPPKDGGTRSFWEY